MMPRFTKSELKSKNIKWIPLKYKLIKKERMVLCRCKCGLEKWIHYGNIKQGYSRTCSKCASTIHGDSYLRLSMIWRGMKHRCVGHKDYGGRGISVCKRWQTYLGFKKWALSNGYADNLTIERINVNGNYTPQNCKFIPRGHQNRNQRRSIKINGKLAMDIAQELNVSRTAIVARIRKGFTEEQIRANPIRLKQRDLPKYITSRPNGNFRVRFGKNGKIPIGDFTTLKGAISALKTYLSTV